jgi:hypothetical protein
MNVTAVVLSRTRIPELFLPEVTVLNHVCQVEDHYEMNAARRESLAKVTTPYWFYLDSDDELPADHVSLLEDCLAPGTHVAYTDELVRQKGKEDIVRRPGPYTRWAHMQNLLMLHHLVVCDTQATRDALPKLPQGHEMFEMCLYFQLAKHSVSYVPRIGYHWNKGNGFHRKPDALRSLVRAAIWCNRNKD